jgi:hypothetical protein
MRDPKSANAKRCAACPQEGKKILLAAHDTQASNNETHGRTSRREQVNNGVLPPFLFISR